VGVIKASALAHLRFTKRDLRRAERYFIDFGLQVAARTERAVYLRGLLHWEHGPNEDALSTGAHVELA